MPVFNPIIDYSIPSNRFATGFHQQIFSQRPADEYWRIGRSDHSADQGKTPRLEGFLYLLRVLQ